MHFAPTLVSGLLTFLLIVIASGMLGAQAWAISVFRPGRPWLPSVPPRAARWGIGTVVVVFLTYVILNTTAYSIVTSLAGPAPAAQPTSAPAPADGLGPAGPKAAKPPPSPSFTAQMLGYTLGNAAAVVVLPLLVLFLARARLADLGLTRDRLLPDAKAGTIAFLVVTPWVYVVFQLAYLGYHGEPHTLEKMLRQEAGPAGVVLAFVSAVLFAPLAEELVFRGVFQAWLNRVILCPPDPVREELADLSDPAVESGGVEGAANSYEAPGDFRVSALPGATGGRAWVPVVASSILFAALHIQVMPTPIPLFVLALALGYLYQRTGSLVAPITLHALFNAFSTLQLLRVVL
jgi:membrane protease YdiL (CAAX protease family)